MARGRISTLNTTRRHAIPPPPPHRDASEGKGPRRRLGGWRRLPKQFGGGYCRLQMPLRLAVAWHRLGAPEGGGGGLPPFQRIPACPPPPGGLDYIPRGSGRRPFTQRSSVAPRVWPLLVPLPCPCVCGGVPLARLVSRLSPPRRGGECSCRSVAERLFRSCRWSTSITFRAWGGLGTRDTPLFLSCGSRQTQTWCSLKEVTGCSGTAL